MTFKEYNEAILKSFGNFDSFSDFVSLPIRLANTFVNLIFKS